MLEIQTIRNFLPQEEFDNLIEYFQNKVTFKYGWSSSKNVSDMNHWNVDFIKSGSSNIDDIEPVLMSNPILDPIYQIWNRLKQDYLKNHVLIRCYANAHTFGVEGAPHTDSSRDDTRTTILYVVPEWRTEWAGETLFYTDTGQMAGGVLPEPNKLFTFDGGVVHCARSVSKLYNGLRITLMFKTRLIDENI